MQYIMFWIIGALALAGGGFAYYANTHSDGAMIYDDTMQQKEQGEAMTKDTSSTDGSMMKDDSEGSMMKDDSPQDAMSDSTMMHTGSYEVYAPEKLAKANSGKVVLFFRASWCPTCKALDADIRSHLSAIPEGVTILDVDYDTSAALKQKYGVTYQHTLVQVKADGSMITKWAGSPTLVSLVAQVR